jgi:MFS family permease
LATDLAHPDRRGTEIGVFHFLVGLAALPASLVAGWLYSHVAPAAPFAVGAFTAFTAALLLLTSKASSSPTPITEKTR